MLDSGRTLDEVARLEWPSEWDFKQRELTQVIWTAPEDQFTPYTDFMKTSTPSCLLPVCDAYIPF